MCESGFILSGSDLLNIGQKSCTSFTKLGKYEEEGIKDPDPYSDRIQIRKTDESTAHVFVESAAVSFRFLKLPAKQNCCYSLLSEAVQ